MSRRITCSWSLVRLEDTLWEQASFGENLWKLGHQETGNYMETNYKRCTCQTSSDKQECSLFRTDKKGKLWHILTRGLLAGSFVRLRENTSFGIAPLLGLSKWWSRDVHFHHGEDRLADDHVLAEWEWDTWFFFLCDIWRNLISLF